MDKILTIKSSFKYFLIILGTFITLNNTDTKDLTISDDSVSYSKVALKERERLLNCLAKNIYYEAGNEPFEGKVAVAQVTVNRVNHSKFPSDVCKVVYQKNTIYNKVVCQFSWHCNPSLKSRPINWHYFRESKDVARKVLYEGYKLKSVKDALYFHADYVEPNWHRERVVKIGRHIFYR